MKVKSIFLVLFVTLFLNLSCIHAENVTNDNQNDEYYITLSWEITSGAYVSGEDSYSWNPEKMAYERVDEGENSVLSGVDAQSTISISNMSSNQVYYDITYNQISGFDTVEMPVVSFEDSKNGYLHYMYGIDYTTKVYKGIVKLNSYSKELNDNPIGSYTINIMKKDINFIMPRYETVNGTRNTSTERAFWQYRDAIEHITINNIIDTSNIIVANNCGISKNEICSWDVSQKQDNSVMAYMVDNGNNLYDLYLMANGDIYAPEDSYALFGAVNSSSGGFANTVSINNLKYLKTNYAVDMSRFFKGMISIEELDVSGFRTSNAKYLNNFLEDCFELRNINLSKFDTSNVINMNSMFNKNLNLSVLDVSSFDTSNVTDMGYMFNNCLKLTSIDASNFNTSKVTNMRGMFSSNEGYIGKSVLKQVDISSFDTAKVTNMNEMFSGQYLLETIYASNKFVTTKASVTNIFGNDKSLVGGNGTKWNSKFVSNKSYANIDTAIYDEDGNLVSGNPGYFSLKVQ